MAIRENEMWDLAAVNRGQKIPAHTKRNHRQRLDRLLRQVAEWEHRVTLARPTCTQVQHLIKKFGGILPFSVACNRHPNHILLYWLGVTKNGRASPRQGLIPSMGMLMRLVVVARSYGVVLRPEDLFPDMLEDGQTKNPHSCPELMHWAMVIDPKHCRGNTMHQLETDIAELLEGN